MILAESNLWVDKWANSSDMTHKELSRFVLNPSLGSVCFYSQACRFAASALAFTVWEFKPILFGPGSVPIGVGQYMIFLGLHMTGDESYWFTFDVSYLPACTSSDRSEVSASAVALPIRDLKLGLFRGMIHQSIRSFQRLAVPRDVSSIAVVFLLVYSSIIPPVYIKNKGFCEGVLLV